MSYSKAHVKSYPPKHNPQDTLEGKLKVQHSKLQGLGTQAK